MTKKQTKAVIRAIEMRLMELEISINRRASKMQKLTIGEYDYSILKKYNTSSKEEHIILTGARKKLITTITL